MTDINCPGTEIMKDLLLGVVVGIGLSAIVYEMFKKPCKKDRKVWLKLD